MGPLKSVRTVCRTGLRVGVGITCYCTYLRPPLDIVWRLQALSLSERDIDNSSSSRHQIAVNRSVTMRLFSVLVIAAASLSTFDSVIGSTNLSQSRGLSTLLLAINSIWALASIAPTVGSSTTIDTRLSGVVPSEKSEILSDVAIYEDKPILTSLASDERLIDPEISSLMEKYKGRLICSSIAEYPDCDILLCGTLHVATTSADMVQDAIKVLKPEYIVLELCEARVDNLCDEEFKNVTLSDVIKESYKLRSVKVFGMGLLTWMQLKTAKALGSKLGAEQTIAAKIGIKQGSTVILGDRLYGVTFQRVFDRLQLFEKLKFAVVLLWEVMTMSFFKLKDYIKKSENQEGFIQDEIARFGKHLPAFAKVLIEERDEYLSQTIYEIARVVGKGYGQTQATSGMRRTRVMAVVGAGHLAGIQRCLAAGGVSDERIIEISSSSKHPHPGTWLGRGMLQVVNPNIFQPQPQVEVAQVVEQEQPAQKYIEIVQEISSPLITDFSPSLTSVSDGVATASIVNTEVVTEVVDDASSIEIASESIETAATAIIVDDVVITETLTEAVAEEEEEDEALTEVDEVEEQVDAVVALLSSLTPIVEIAHAAVEKAKESAITAGLELPHDLITHLSLLGEAVTDAKKAFLLADEADKRSAAPDEIEIGLNELTNAIVRATVAAKAVVESAQIFSSACVK